MWYLFHFAIKISVFSRDHSIANLFCLLRILPAKTKKSMIDNSSLQDDIFSKHLKDVIVDNKEFDFNLLKEKDAPCDRGQEILEELMKRRIKIK